MATGNAYEMEMNGAQKANKTMETTTTAMAARDNGPVAMALRIRLVVPAFVCSFVFLPLFSTSAVTLLLALLLLLLLSLYCCCPFLAAAAVVVLVAIVFLHGWSRAQRSQHVLCERSEKIVAQLLRQLHEYLQVPQRECDAQSSSRQFTCT